MKDRAKQLIKYLLMLGAFAAVYILIWRLGVDIKCPFYELTGYLCSGCGLSRMLVSLIRLDLKSAAFYNLGGLILLPLWLAVAISYCREYLKSGMWTAKKWHKAVFAVSIAVFIVYGIARNLTDLGLHYTDDIDFFKK